MDIENYRTPEEVADSAADDARVQELIDTTHDDVVSLYAAMNLDEPQAVVDKWVDKLWGRLDSLTKGDLAHMVVLLIEPYADTATQALLRGDNDGPA